MVFIVWPSVPVHLKSTDESPIKIVDKVFREYIKYSESTDSRDDKEAMQSALQALQAKHDTKDLDILINVWMYYDPTDFPTGDLIMPIFETDPGATLTAIEKRIKKKKKWENKETAPYSDLIELREKFRKYSTD